MIREFFRVTLWAVLIWAVGQLVLVASADAGDYVVTRGTVIESQRPIWLLVVEAGLGVVNAEVWPLRNEGGGVFVRSDLGAIRLQSVLAIDGRPAPGIGGMASAVWRLVGFVLWDADGEISRVTRATVRGHSVEIRDRVRDGWVGLVVTVGPPLGDPRVRFAVLQLEAVENAERFFPFEHERFSSTTRIDVSCSAVIDLPFDARRERVHARRQRWGCERPTLSEGIAQREAGVETAATVERIELAGRAAVQAGRDEIQAAVGAFIDRKCP